MKILFFIILYAKILKKEIKNIIHDNEMKQDLKTMWSLLISNFTISYYISDATRLNIYSGLCIFERIYAIRNNIKSLKIFQKYPNISFVALSLCTTSVMILYYAQTWLCQVFFILILLTLIIIVLIYHLYTIYRKVPLLKLLIISTKYIISAIEINIKQRKCHPQKILHTLLVGS